MSDRLSLLIWPDYIDPATLAAFESETGVSVDLEIVPSSAEIIKRIMNGRRAPDVLTPPDYAVLQLNAKHRLATLDHALLPNLKHLEPRFLYGRAHDVDSRVSVVKDWGTTGFMYRPDKIRGLPTSWTDFWQLSAEHSGRTTVVDSHGEVIGAALKMRGASYNASDPKNLEQARRDLLRLKPHLLCFETNYRPLLASGEAWLSLGWNVDAAALLGLGVPVHYVIPTEGSQIWEDDWAIASNAANPLGAHAFIDFMLRPEVAAGEARYTRYATGNRSALALLEESIQHDPSTYPAQEIIGKLEAGMPLDARGRARRQALWNEIRA